MIRIRRRYFIAPLTLVIWLASTLAYAQDCRSGTVKEVYDCHYEKAAEVEVAESVKAASRGTTAPDAFASRVHNSYQDFLSAISFAINMVEESEDGRALIVRFNPLRKGSHLLGVTLTAAEPGLAESLTKAIPEDQRPAAEDALDDQLTDIDDVTIAGSYSFQSSDCELGGGRWSCWGRGPTIYRDKLSELIDLTIEDDDPTLTVAFSEVAKKLPLGDLFTLQVDSIDEDLREEVLDLLQRLATQDAAGTEAARQRHRAAGFDTLATLIENQPQLAITASYRDTGEFVGPDERALSLELHFGKTNLNTLYRDCQGSSTCVRDSLRMLAIDPVSLSTDKFVLTVSYKQRLEFDVPSLDLPDDLDVDFPGLHLPDNDKLQVRLQWGHQIQSNLGRSLGSGPGLLPGSDHASPEKARWDLALEGTRNSEDGVRTESRWVATWTLTYPLSSQISIPVTVSYANEPEFLGDPREEISAHLGISYRFPWEK